MKIGITFSKGTAKALLVLSLLFSIGCYIVLMPMIRSANENDVETTKSNVTITKQVAISISGNLTAGVTFGSANPGASDINATYNFNGTTDPTWGNQTLYWITIDTTTNTNLDICTKSNANLTSGSYFIPDAGYTWASSITNNYTLPIYPPTTAYTSDFTYDTSNLVADDISSGTYYMRFALDIPAGQQSGTYNNTLYFRGQENTTTCGT